MSFSELGDEQKVSRPCVGKWCFPHVTTLVTLGIWFAIGAIAAAWIGGFEPIQTLFVHLDRVQENPPIWLQVPSFGDRFLWMPSLILLAIASLVTQFSSLPRTRSRAIVVAILLAVTLRYLLWRSLATLNLSTPINGIFSLGLFGLELLLVSSRLIQVYLTLRIQDRSHEADRRAIAVTERKYTPSVDILIPTYNEPEFILRRTIIGAQALDYDRKNIYLLDDTRRPEIARLARELGCCYVTRTHNLYAKAGNLNHAIAHTTGELIVVFDADFIPTRNFLQRTVGFFQDSNVALVQTPQTFYNPDPIARNLGLEDILTPEEEVFYRYIQPIRDGVGSVICAGTSFVVRRSALAEVGNFVTDSLSEDYFTGIRLAARGYRVIYLDEKLSAGLAAENIGDHIAQRLRWVRGTLQAFFIDSNPLTIPGLTFVQRLAHLEGLIYWFGNIARLALLLMPLGYTFLGIVPIEVNLAEFTYFFLPYYLISISTFAWLNRRSRSAILSEFYSIVTYIPLTITVLQVLLNPFSKQFNVTPKGKTRDRFYFNWKIAWPLLLILIGMGFAFIKNLSIALGSAETPAFEGINLAWIWSLYNFITIAIALFISIDVPNGDLHPWLALRRQVLLTETDNKSDRHPEQFWGRTIALSETGGQVECKAPLSLRGDRLTLELLGEKLTLSGQIEAIEERGEYYKIKMNFDRLNLEQHRRLVELLFCRCGQWQYRETPGELQSFFLLFKILLKPRILCDRDRTVKPLPVNQL
ncbi:MAG: glycosyltransferase [Cyanobacteria bacterium J007]|nr:MAG: glycosyltransferase [Cyanobacteria bacterium J007]